MVLQQQKPTKTNKKRKSPAIEPTECWAVSAGEWVRQENYLAGRSGSGKTLPFNLSGEVPLGRGTASCDRWLESTEQCFAGGEFTNKCKEGWFRSRNDKGWWGSNLRSSASLVSLTGFLQMLVGALRNARGRLVLFHEQLNCYWGCVGLSSVPVSGGDSGTDKCLLRHSAQQLQVTVLQPQIPQKFEVFKLHQAAWKNFSSKQGQLVS